MHTRQLPIGSTYTGSSRPSGRRPSKRRSSMMSASAPAALGSPALAPAALTPGAVRSPAMVPAPAAVHTPVTYGNPAPVVVYQQAVPTNSAAIVALVLSLISFTTSFCLLGFVGIIFGHIARSQIKKGSERGNGMAVAGLWLGYLSVIFWIVFWLLYFGVIALVIAAGVAAGDIS